MSSAICERAPSAPTRNRARWVKVVSEIRLCRVTVTPSASWVWLRYSVLKETFAPRLAALVISTGSINGCGTSSMVQGLPCR